MLAMDASSAVRGNDRFFWGKAVRFFLVGETFGTPNGPPGQSNAIASSHPNLHSDLTRASLKFLGMRALPRTSHVF